MSTRTKTVIVESAVETQEHVCDKCGAAGQDMKQGPFSMSRYTLHTDGWVMAMDRATAGAPERNYDLCEGCMGKFEKWLATRPPRGGKQA